MSFEALLELFHVSDCGEVTTKEARARLSKIFTATATKMLREESRAQGILEPDGGYPGLAESMTKVVASMPEDQIRRLHCAHEAVLEAAIRGLMGDSTRAMVAKSARTLRAIR